MTEALIVPTVFGGKEIRIIEKDGETWMPCKDLSVALGLDRSTLYHHIQRNLDFFGETAIDGDILSHGEGDYWVNEQGLYLLLARVSTGRVHPEAKAAIISFRKTVPSFLQMYRKREIVQVPEDTLDLELEIARHLSEKTGGDLTAFQAIALERHGLKHYVPALKVSPTYVHGETGWYTVTQLCDLCPDDSLSGHPERLNQYLKNKGYQYRDENRLWRLEPIAMTHGKEYAYNLGNGHSEPRISWRESILYASGLKRPLSASQIALPVRV